MQMTAAHAVAEFKARIPELAQGALEIIANEREGNERFVAAFGTFHALCKTALDPRISEAQIDEMLVQHLLTERLLRLVFDDQDFTRRNAIASEIGNVIDALTFSRGEFLRSLDRFYGVIEDTARALAGFSERQHFLNLVCERFFQGFSTKQADTMGIVYTPQEIVDFMCASVDEALRREFGKSLSTPGVKIIDPCVGAGNFIVNILRRIDRSRLKQKYTQDLFCNETMLLPYYIASLNIEHEYFQLTGEYEPFEGIRFADTLDLAVSEGDTACVARGKGAEVTVIIGNPPYNVGQRNENDNNKNRRYEVIDKRIRDTYAKDSQATLKTQLYDAYVRFFRWATDRLEGRDGIVCFVSNNSFVDQVAFDGMRKHLMQDFTHIYHLDLHGNVRKNPKLSGTTHNVFGIQIGVGITMAVRRSECPARTIHYYRVPETWTRHDKCGFIAERKSGSALDWSVLTPDGRNTWLTEGLRDDFEAFVPVGTKEGKATSAGEAETVFKAYGGGVKTNRDGWAYDFDRAGLAAKVGRFIDTYNSEVDRWQRRAHRAISVDAFVTEDESKIKWSGDLKVELTRGHEAVYEESNVRHCLYRPFNRRFLYLDRLLNNSVYLNHRFFPAMAKGNENRAIIVGCYDRKGMSVLATQWIPDLNFYADPAQCFPFYTYNEDGSDRRENITDWALALFREKYGDRASKWDIFHYVYAMLHHPGYRERYAGNLKRELPRIPMTVAVEDFPAYVEIGRKLAEAHLNYETAKEYPLKWLENNEVPSSRRVEKMRLSKDKSALVVNDSLTLTGFPSECFDYRLGNRSALEWVIDQYRVSIDKRSGITTDPNRADDPEYIVRLVGRVVTVSVETVNLIRALPDL